MLEEQHRQMLYEKNEPIYILTGYIFKAFCSDEEAHVQWETEKAMASGVGVWNEELHQTWFGVGKMVYQFITENKESLRL